jgi:hypothetical protein
VDDAFVFVNALTGTAGQFTISGVGKNFLVGLDATGNSLRDAEIFVVAPALDSGDFIL